MSTAVRLFLRMKGSANKLRLGVHHLPQPPQIGQEIEVVVDGKRVPARVRAIYHAVGREHMRAGELTVEAEEI